MWTLYVTLLILQMPTGTTTVVKQEVSGIVSAEECEKAAHEWRLQALANNKQVMTVCIKKTQ